MKIRDSLEETDGVFHAQIEVEEFSAAEQESIDQHGDPLVECGGVFSGSVTRPGRTGATLDATGGGGSGLDTKLHFNLEGELTSVEILDGGTGYTSPPTLTINGDGNGATVSATVADGAVTAIAVDTPGTGYVVTPVDVTFTLPTRPRRLDRGFPVKQSFDVRDSLDADARAKFWLTTMSTRMQAARTSVTNRQNTLVGENVSTV